MLGFVVLSVIYSLASSVRKPRLMIRALGEIKQGHVIVTRTVGANLGRGLKKGLSER